MNRFGLKKGILLSSRRSVLSCYASGPSAFFFGLLPSPAEHSCHPGFFNRDQASVSRAGLHCALAGLVEGRHSAFLPVTGSIRRE